jgi:predicted metalloprotease
VTSLDGHAGGQNKLTSKKQKWVMTKKMREQTTRGTSKENRRKVTSSGIATAVINPCTIQTYMKRKEKKTLRFSAIIMGAS